MIAADLHIWEAGTRQCLLHRWFQSSQLQNELSVNKLTNSVTNILPWHHQSGQPNCQSSLLFLTVALMLDTTADTTVDTPDTFSGTVLFQVTKTTRYAARLLLWQWKQWLNRGADWNNPSVCPLVPQTSCLTKPNPCWCWAFRLVSLCFCFTLFPPSVLSVLLAEARSTLRVTGYWPNLFFSVPSRQQCAQPVGEREEEWVKEMEKERGRTQRGGQKAELGERWNKLEIES